MDGLAIAASLNELRPAVEGAFVRNIYQPARDVFIVKLSGSPDFRLLVSPKAASIHRTDLNISNPPHPTNYVMLLRKHLRGGRITDVRQRSLDRVVTLDVERRDGRRTSSLQLIAELAGLRGNLLLVREGTVLGTSRVDDRNRPGRPYVALPPQEKADPQSPKPDAIAEWLQSTESSAEATVAIARHVDGLNRRTAADAVKMAELADAEDGIAERIAREIAALAQKASSPSGFVDTERMLATFYEPPGSADRMERFSEALDRVLEASGALGNEQEASAELRRAQRDLARHERTAEKLRSWLDSSDDATRLRRQADLLLTHQSELPASAAEVTVADLESGKDICICLDPSMTPVENAQRLHRRAKRLRRGRPRVEQRLRRIEREISELRSSVAEMKARPAQAAAAMERSQERREREKTERSTAGRRFAIDGFTVLVGRNARENDELLRMSSGDDVWLHARGAAGSHVIVRRGGRREIPADVLRKAAGLAAFHSKARKERRVVVTLAAAKHVRKPRSAPAGLAIVEAEDTLTVDPGLREWE